MRLANFPGCSASTTGKAYTESFNYVANQVGIELDTIPNWACCGASAGHMQSHDLGDALPARSLANSEEAFGDEPVLALCAGCYVNLRRAEVHAKASEERAAEISQMIGKPYESKAHVMNGVEPFLDADIQKAVSEHVTQPLNGLKVACYYGCALVRPRELCNFDDEENPQSMEKVIALTGAEPIEWNRKTECCGASHHISVPGDVKPLVDRILSDAVECGAEAIATACPLCNMNLDMREAEINKMRAARGEQTLDVPVYYFTELLASSFGGPDDQIGVNRNFHPGSATLAEAKKRPPKPTEEELKAQRVAAAKAKAAARKAAKETKEVAAHE